MDADTDTLATEGEVAATGGDKTAYRVLARKYRPTNFDELIGQDALVRTLTNAISSGRIAQAFMLTGVRGVGKTTTARIVAKALNCIGPDGKGGPTIKPCGVCDNCRAITEDRHVDVQEMDAASRTGVDDIRELIEGVRYRPVAARYKIYILDEVHMLSKNAFNALLKTLEEPPEHVKFIFATTEIRKVPVTVLSRCQRFDLRRVPIETLAAHFRNVCARENVQAEDDAIAMVARAADGSVRDGLSILDQAIALSGDTVTAGQVRDMLGLADRAMIFDLFEAAMQGDANAALDAVGGLYDNGADPVVIMQDLLDVTYWITRAKLSPAILQQPATPEIERTRGGPMAEKLGMPVLTRAWNLLLKGLTEVQNAPNPIQAAEMVIVRLVHASDLPTPGDLVKTLKGGTPSGGGATGGNAPSGSGQGGTTASGSPHTGSGGAPQMRAIAGGGGYASPRRAEDVAPAAAGSLATAAIGNPRSYDEVVELFKTKKEGIIATQLTYNAHLVRFSVGQIDLRLNKDAPKDLIGRVGKLLTEWTGHRWVVSHSNEAGEQTIAEREQSKKQAVLDAAENEDLVKAVKRYFPDARVKSVSGGLPETDETAALTTGGERMLEPDTDPDKEDDRE